MIVVRNVFRVKYGQAKPALEALKGMDTLRTKLGLTGGARVLTDLTGPAYTIVLEIQFANLAGFEEEGKTLFTKPEWRTMFEKFLPYVESGSREIYTLVQ